MRKRKASGDDEQSAQPKSWKDEEIGTLIRIWSDEAIQQQLERGNNHVKGKAWKIIVQRMNEEENITCTLKQCKNKIGKLRIDYESTIKQPSGSQRETDTMPFFDELDAILGSRHSSNPPSLRDSLANDIEQTADSDNERDANIDLYNAQDDQSRISEASSELSDRGGFTLFASSEPKSK